MLAKSLRTRASLVSVPRRTYERMSTEDYLVNIRKAMTNPHVQRGKMSPLLEASK